MARQTGRFEWICKLARIALIAGLTTLAFTVAATAVQLVGGAGKADAWTTAFRAVSIVGQFIAAVGCIVAYGLVRLLVTWDGRGGDLSGRLDRLEALMADSNDAAKRTSELVSLSDKTKSLIYRERELEAIRETIHHDLISQRYQAAEAMIDEIEKDFGYADEAAQLRQEVEESRKATLDEKIDAAISRIQTILRTHDWARGLREARRIMKLFPDNERISALPHRINDAREQHKRQLLQNYGEAVRKNDIDRGVELLKELDLYLTPQEAAALEESARGVFKARLHQFGVQFAISVSDQRWNEAIAAGEQIIREFPNSRMAQEVRQKLDVLRTKAAPQKPEG